MAERVPDGQMAAPWGQPDWLAWAAYADCCFEQCNRKEQLRALRLSMGLRLRPKLVLVGVSPIGGVRDRGVTLPLAPHRPLVDGWKAWRDLRWKAWRDLRWVTLTHASRVFSGGQGEDARSQLAAALGATPLDFPGMTGDLTWRNRLLRGFYCTAAYDVRVDESAGVVRYTNARTGKEIRPPEG